MVRETRAQKRKREEEAKAQDDKQPSEPVEPYDEPNGPTESRGEVSDELHQDNPDDGPRTPFEWDGVLLPQFETPYWKIRSGVPTLCLQVESLTNRLRKESEEIPLGTPTPLPLKLPDQPPLKRRPTPPKASEQPDWEKDPVNIITIDSKADSPPLRDFARFAKDDPEHDVKDKALRIEGEPQEEEVKIYGEKLAKFIRSPFDDADVATWHGVRPLGRGGYGMAGLWEQKDVNGKVVDQMVIKQFGTVPRRPRDPKIPTEVKVMRLLKELPEPKGTVDLHRYKRYPRREVHRLYMEFCPHGDLYRVVKDYRAKKKFIPEAFIWDVFYHLALACQSLENIASEYPPNKRHVVHRDIKPSNVFLGQAGKGKDGDREMYPTAKLGDYGAAIFTGPNDRKNPREYRGTGTEGYMALEQEDHDNPPRPSPHNRSADALARFRHLVRHESWRGATHPRLLSHTNVWGVGATIFELMTLKQARYYLYNRGLGLEDDALEGIPGDEAGLRINDDMRRRYGAGVGGGEKDGEGNGEGDENADHGLLIQIMRRCLRPNPARRPTVAELVDITRRERDKWRAFVTKQRKQQKKEQKKQQKQKRRADEDAPTTASVKKDAWAMPWTTEEYEEMSEGSWYEEPGHENKLYEKGSTFRSPTKRVKVEKDEGEGEGESDESDDTTFTSSSSSSSSRRTNTPTPTPTPTPGSGSRGARSTNSPIRFARPYDLDLDDEADTPDGWDMF